MSDKENALAAAKRLNQKIGLKLRELRILKRLSQEQLGLALGVSFQQVQKYENGANRLSAARLVQVAAFLDVPVSRFFEGFEREEEDEGETFDKRILQTAANLNAIRNQKTILALMKLIKVLTDK